MFPNTSSKQLSSVYFLLGTSTDFCPLDRRWKMEKIKESERDGNEDRI